MIKPLNLNPLTGIPEKKQKIFENNDQEFIGTRTPHYFNAHIDRWSSSNVSLLLRFLMGRFRVFTYSYMTCRKWDAANLCALTFVLIVYCNQVIGSNLASRSHHMKLKLWLFLIYSLEAKSDHCRSLVNCESETTGWSSSCTQIRHFKCSHDRFVWA